MPTIKGFLNAEKEPAPTVEQTTDALHEALGNCRYRKDAVSQLCGKLGLGDRLYTVKDLEGLARGNLAAISIKTEQRYEDVVVNETVQYRVSHQPSLQRLLRMIVYQYLKRGPRADPLLLVFNGRSVWKGRPCMLNTSWTAIRGMDSFAVRRIKKTPLPSAVPVGKGADSELNRLRNERAAKRTKRIDTLFKPSNK